jgi:3',5'-cyclic AMP phosphodiesterase CpdA
MRIIQISDTHLSPNKSHFAANWPPLAEWIARQRADLVIHTGDVTVDGAADEEDLRHAAALMRGLDVRLLAVPGNHDVGDGANPNQPINDQRLARWRMHFGVDRWVEDVEGFRLIGFDAMLLGSGHTEETAQAAWLEAAMQTAGGRIIAWFLHRPLFLDSPEEGDTGYWSLAPEPRGRLVELMRRYPVALVGSGHLHRAHDFRHQNTRYVWAPSSAFLVGPGMAPSGMPGHNRLGAVLYEFDNKTFEAEIVAVPGFVTYFIDDVVNEVYPRPATVSSTLR